MRWQSIILGTCLFIFVAGHADAWDRGRLDSFSDYCSLRENAPVSQKCVGFVSGVIEMIDAGRVRRDSVFQGICLPADLSVQEAVLKIRRYLRKKTETCDGFCSGATFAWEALEQSYPCASRK